MSAEQKRPFAFGSDLLHSEGPHEGEGLKLDLAESNLGF